jgi:DHA3 family macrolide efflux protein-like MFS transporter
MNALRLYILETSKSVGLLAWVSLFAEIPCLVFSMPSGAMADSSHDGRRLLLWPAIASTVTGALMMVMFYSGYLDNWHIYLVIFIMATCTVVREPMVDRIFNMRLKSVAFARWSAAFNFALGVCETIAPALAAWLVASVGLFSVATFDSLCCIGAGLAVYNAPHWLDTPLVVDPAGLDDDADLAEAEHAPVIEVCARSVWHSSVDDFATAG